MSSSRQNVSPTGKAYGLDMTDEMLALARENQIKAGIENVEFLKGAIENVPLPDNSVDVIISNCVINLSGDKDRVLREAFRVLSLAAASPFPTWSSAAKSPPTFARAWNSGSAASLAPSRSTIPRQTLCRRLRIRGHRAHSCLQN